MADNVTANAGSGGAVFATDDVAGVHYPFTKIAFGALDTANVVTSTTTHPFPVALSDTDNAVLDAMVVDLAAMEVLQTSILADTAAMVIDLAAIEVLATTIAGDTTSIDSKITACNTGAVVVASGTLTGITNSVAVTGTFWQATQPVSGTFWQETQPVSLASVPSHAVTNAGTFAVQVSGDALTALQLIDNAVSGAGFNITQLGGAAVPIGTGLEATAVRVTLATDSTGLVSIDDNGGSITVDGTVAVTGTFWQATQPVSGTFWQATQPVSLASVPSHAVTNAGTFAVQVDGAALTALQLIDNCISGNEAQVDVVTAPVRDRLTDNVGVALQTDVILSDTSALTPKFAKIDAASTGNNELVALVADKKIRVLSAFLVAAGAVNVRFESDADGTALTGQMNLTTNSGFTLPFNPVGWFETAAGVKLNLELSADISVDGALVYVEV